MPRRAPRKPDPKLDLTGYLLTLAELPVPLNPAALFPVSQPLEVEIGSGKGLFLATAALAAGNRNFLGIELAPKYAQFAAAKLARQQTPNARMISGDALRVFREILASRSLAAVHVYFPDPWWKKRHRKRRVMNGGLIGDIVRTLEPGGLLHFWTDVEEYFQTTLELLREFPALEGPLAVDERPAEHDLDYHTHFERRTRQSGLPVYRSRFVRRPEPNEPRSEF